MMAAHDASDNNLGFSVDSQLDDNVPLILDSSSIMAAKDIKLVFSEDSKLDDNFLLNLRDTTTLSVKRDFDDDDRESHILFKISKVAVEEGEQGEGGGEEQEVDQETEEEIKSGDQASPFSDENDELESLENYLLFNLQAVSDPAKTALDIIQNPIIQMEHKMGDNAVIIDDSNILMLKELRKISPDIKPHVKEEAMKLALDVEAYIGHNTDNSAAILGFLLLVSIYGLAVCLDEDEILKLFGFAAQHEMAVELFGILGFADKASDLVKKLIIKEQYIEAERFFGAYLMPTKIEQPISCIQENRLH